MSKIKLVFTEEELISSSIYSRLEYLHESINGSLLFSPLKCFFLDEATALISYCEEKKYHLPEHILLKHKEDISKHSKI